MKNVYAIIAIIFITILFVYFLSKNKPTPQNFPPQNNTIIAFGDSLVEGRGSTQNNDFITLLSKKISKPILNYGIPSNTTADGLARVDQIIEQNPGTVLLLLGGNDYLRKVPKQQTFDNLEKIISKLHAQGIFVILLGVRGGILTDGFDNSFENLADKMNVPLVPNVLSGLFGNDTYMSDTVHPNDAGYAKIAEKVYNEVGKYLDKQKAQPG